MSAFKEGLVLFKEGFIEEAIEKFQEYLELDDQNPKVWNALGVALMKSSDYQNAQTCFNNAILLDSDNEIYVRNNNKCLEKIKTLQKNNLNLEEPDEDILYED